MSKTRELIEAAAKGELERVKQLIEIEKVEVNSKGSHFGTTCTALYFAAWQNHLEVVKYLTQHGADLSAKDHNDITPLIIAADCARVEILAHLLEQKKVDINAVSRFGQSALMRTVRPESDKIFLCAKMLIDKKADVNLQDQSGNTAIMLAEDPRTFDLLLEAKINIELKNKEGKTLLLNLCESEWLSSKESFRRLEKLFKKFPDIDVNVIDNEGNSAIDLILKSEIEGNDEFGIKKLKLMLTKKITPDLVARPFHSIWTTPSRNLKRLIDAGFTPPRNSCLEILTYGYITNTFDDCYFSIDEKAFKKIDSKEGFNKLYIKALKDNKFKIAFMLIKFIDPNAKDEDGKSLLELTLMLKQVSLSDQLTLAEALIEAGANKEQIDAEDQSLFMRLISSRFSHDQAIFLIKKDVKLSLISKDGQTVLHVATKTRSPKLVKCILDHHADCINLLNNQNQTALVIAALNYEHSRHEDYLEVIKLLLNANADRKMVCTGVWSWQKITFGQIVERHWPLREFIKEYDEQALKDRTQKSSVASISQSLQIAPAPASATVAVEIKSAPSEETIKIPAASPLKEASQKSAFTFSS